MGCCQDGFGSSGGGPPGGGNISGDLTADFFPIAVGLHTLADDVLFKRDLGADIELIWGDGASGVGPAVGYQFNIEGIPGHLRSFGLRAYGNDRVTLSLGGDENFSIRAYDDSTGVEIDRPIFIHLDAGGVVEVRRPLDPQFDIVFSESQFNIYPTTADGADTSEIVISGGGGGAGGSPTRGSVIRSFGNENAVPGSMQLLTGNVAGAEMDIRITDGESEAYHVRNLAASIDYILVDSSVGAEVVYLGTPGSGIETYYDIQTGNFTALAALVAGAGATQIVLNGLDGNSSFAGYAWVHGMLIVGSASQLHEETLVVAANAVAINAQLSDLFVVDFSTATGTVTFATPTNVGVGRRFIIKVVQGGAPHACAFSAAYSFPGGVAPVLSGAGAHDYLPFIYNSISTKWDYLPGAFNYT